MAVYTEVSDEDLEAFVADYDIGEVVSCKGIAEGVENSNYLLHTEDGPYILTLYERRVAPQDLPFFLNLMEHLAASGLPCPTPLRGRDGKSLRTLCGRPAAIITFLTGMWPRRIQPFHCSELGEALATLHLAGEVLRTETPQQPVRRRLAFAVRELRRRRRYGRTGPVQRAVGGTRFPQDELAPGSAHGRLSRRPVPR